MSNYAVMQDDVVVNVVLADEDSEGVLSLLIPDADDFIIVTDETGQAYVGGDMLDGRFRPPAPYASWEWADDAWTPPIPYPQDGAAYVWDEEQGDWIEYVAPEPEPEPVTE